MSTFCKGCNEPTNTVSDETMGHTVCEQCGTVLEENAVVAEVQFSEKSNGATVSDGFFIGAGQARAKSGGSAGYSRFGMSAQDANEQREISLQNGYRRIAAVANSLRMTQRHIESAERWFKLAASHNFTKGRKTANVAAACLYIVCRMEKTSHMLIDFSDVLQTNVFIIGSTYVKLVDILHLREKIPHLDPALYIARFAARLEFDDLTQKVITDSLRLVSRMDRDWMKLGRRPAGICAAALFIAARMNGFKRTMNEIVHVVKICEATLRRRLEEFQQTPSGALTVEDFQNIWLEGSEDPPSFAMAAKKDTTTTSASGSLKRKGDSSVLEADAEEDVDNDEEEENDNDQEKSAGEATSKNSANNNDNKKQKTNKGKGVAKAAGQISGTSEEEEEQKDLEAGQNGERGGRSSSKKRKSTENSEEQEEDDEDEEDALIAQEMKEALAAKELADVLKSIQDAADDNNLEALDDDLEVQGAVLSQAEIDFKTLVWTDVNKEWLELQEMKKHSKQAPARATRKRGGGGRRSQQQQIPLPPAASAAEAAKNLVSTKRALSNKINYDVLNCMFED